MIVGKKKFNYGEVTTEPIYEGLAVAANVLQIGDVADLEHKTICKH